jgi:hypothetical protein
VSEYLFDCFEVIVYSYEEAKSLGELINEFLLNISKETIQLKTYNDNGIKTTTDLTEEITPTLFRFTQELYGNNNNVGIITQIFRKLYNFDNPGSISLKDIIKILKPLSTCLSVLVNIYYEIDLMYSVLYDNKGTGNADSSNLLWVLYDYTFLQSLSDENIGNDYRNSIITGICYSCNPGSQKLLINSNNASKLIKDARITGFARQFINAVANQIKVYKEASYRISGPAKLRPVDFKKLPRDLSQIIFDDFKRFFLSLSPNKIDAQKKFKKSSRIIVGCIERVFKGQPFLEADDEISTAFNIFWENRIRDLGVNTDISLIAEEPEIKLDLGNVIRQNPLRHSTEKEIESRVANQQIIVKYIPKTLEFKVSRNIATSAKVIQAIETISSLIKVNKITDPRNIRNCFPQGYYPEVEKYFITRCNKIRNIDLKKSVIIKIDRTLRLLVYVLKGEDEIRLAVTDYHKYGSD